MIDAFLCTQNRLKYQTFKLQPHTKSWTVKDSPNLEDRYLTPQHGNTLLISDSFLKDPLGLLSWFPIFNSNQYNASEDRDFVDEIEMSCRDLTWHDPFTDQWREKSSLGYSNGYLLCIICWKRWISECLAKRGRCERRAGCWYWNQNKRRTLDCALAKGSDCESKWDKLSSSGDSNPGVRQTHIYDTHTVFVK